MTVPVLWVTRHPDTVMARGYADQGMLEAIIDRSLWRPPGSFEVTHHIVEGNDWPDVRGAVVILPARHHACDDDVAWFIERLDKLDWSLVVLAGDEEWVFPWQRIPELSTRKVWVMQPRPEHAELSGLVPGGWSPGTRESLARYEVEALERPIDWFFAGQVTHERREQCVKALTYLGSGILHETEGYMQGMEIEQFRRLMASAKVAPCPSGPYTVDTNRPLEALECGTVPVCDTISPRGPRFDYWSLVFGPGHPLLTIEDWAELPRFIEMVVEDGWASRSNHTFAWWQQWKRDICYRFHTQLRELQPDAERVHDHNDDITAIITTSPVASHPDTSIIEQTVASIRQQLPTTEIVIVADGVRPEQENLRADYDEYLRRLLWKCNFEWHNVVAVLLPEWVHQANAVRRALEFVRTPQILFVEHDTPLEGEIDWHELTDVVASGKAECIRLHFDVDIHPEHRYLMLDPDPVNVIGENSLVGVPLIRTVAWWQRPHLASTRFYRDKVMAHFTETSRTMIEDRLYGVVESNWRDNGAAGWWDWRIFIYADYNGDGEGIKRSGHLDARGAASKFDMVYE